MQRWLELPLLETPQQNTTLGLQMVLVYPRKCRHQGWEWGPQSILQRENSYADIITSSYVFAIVIVCACSL